jgi:hypothetical protein
MRAGVCAVAVGGVLVASVVGVASAARADAYAWGGESVRLKVSAMVPGFNEGAGEGGYDEDSARAFASWAARFDAVVPRDSSVSIDYDGANDDDSTITIRRPGAVDVVLMAGQPDLEGALRVVARSFGAAPPPAPGPSPRLFTIQLLGTHSEDGASRFSDGLTEREVTAEGSFFYEVCLPCRVADSRVLDAGSDGVYRVVIGVFDDRARAEGAARKLRRTSGLRGFVREI